jgi:hypothetical protein
VAEIYFLNKALALFNTGEQYPCAFTLKAFTDNPQLWVSHVNHTLTISPDGGSDTDLLCHM